MKKSVLFICGTAFSILNTTALVIAQPQPGESGAGLPPPSEMPTPPGVGQFPRFGDRENEGNDQQRQQFRQKMLQRFDANHNGQLDESEREQMHKFAEQREQGNGEPEGQGLPIQEMSQRRQRMMQRFDSNNDGQLDDNEREQMRQFIQQRRMMREQRSEQKEGPASNKPGPGPAIN